jgi:hypothetical protein
MYRGQVRSGGLLGMDRAVADELQEINELRRSRSLPEYEPTRIVVTARQRSRWCRAVRIRRVHG